MGENQDKQGCRNEIIYPLLYDYFVKPPVKSCHSFTCKYHFGFMACEILLEVDHTGIVHGTLRLPSCSVTVACKTCMASWIFFLKKCFQYLGVWH